MLINFVFIKLEIKILLKESELHLIQYRIFWLIILGMKKI